MHCCVAVLESLLRWYKFVTLCVSFDAMAANQEEAMNLFPKSSGPPGTPSSSTEMYIRRRVTHEVYRALATPGQLPEWALASPPTHGSFPPPPRTPALPSEGYSDRAPLPRAPPPVPYLTLTAGQGMNAASIQIHNEEMANRMLERIHDSLPGRSRGRSRSPPVHPGSPLPRRRQAIADEPDSSAELAVLQAGQRTFDYPEGPMLPEPSRDWIKVTTEDYTELWVRFHPVPPHQKGRFDHQHAVWAQFYCTRIVASMELYGFDPTDDTKEKKPQWKLFEKLLLHYRAPVIQDYSRIRAAVELTSDQCPVLNAGPFSAQERWLATLLAGADANARYAWSDEAQTLRMGYVPIQQVKSLARSLSAVQRLKPFVREDMMDGRGAYWLFPAGTDQFQGFNDSGGYEAPVGIFLILGTTLPDDPNTCYSVPFVHNTVCQDLSSIIDQRVIRPSYYDRGDKTWPPSLGFYGRMVHPTSAIRQPVLDGSQPDHLYAMTSSMHTARRYGGKESDTRTVAAIGWTLVRQHKHAKVAHSSDPVFGHMFDLVHGTDGRWLFRSSRSILTGAATFWSNWQA